MSRYPPVLPFRSAVARQVEAAALEEARIQRLLQLQTDVLAQQPQGEPLPSTRRLKAGWQSKLLGATALLSTLVLALLLLTQWWLQPGTVEFYDQIAQEVVENHLKLKPLDVSTDSMSSVQGYFTELDFSPLPSSAMGQRYDLGEQLLLGGRYCSILGATAAQLRFQSPDGMITLYQAGYDPQRYGVIPEFDSQGAPLVLFVKGLQVSMWVEKGLLMVLVQSAE